jgi:hypothetical protein
MSQALALINTQTDAVNSYFQQAGAAFDQQYNTYYGQTMQDAANAIAGSGVFNSPVSENMLGRTRQSLASTYATGKSSLAGQEESALGGIDQQKVSYYQTLGGLQAQEAANKADRKQSTFNTILSVGASLL